MVASAVTVTTAGPSTTHARPATRARPGRTGAVCDGREHDGARSSRAEAIAEGEGAGREGGLAGPFARPFLQWLPRVKALAALQDTLGHRFSARWSSSGYLAPARSRPLVSAAGRSDALAASRGRGQALSRAPPNGSRPRAVELAVGTRLPHAAAARNGDARRRGSGCPPLPLQLPLPVLSFAEAPSAGVGGRAPAAARRNFSDALPAARLAAAKSSRPAGRCGAERPHRHFALHRTRAVSA